MQQKEKIGDGHARGGGGSDFWFFQTVSSKDIC